MKMSNESDSDLDERIEILKLKYLQKKNEVFYELSAAQEDGAARRRPALQQISRTHVERPHSGADSEDEPSDPDDSPEETHVFCTETDVTLPSNLVRSSSSSVPTRRRTDHESRGSGAAVHVYQEMLHIYEKLQAERLSQQAWALDLCERERDLQQQEDTRAQHRRSSHRLRQAEQEVLRRIQTLQQKYEQEKSELEASLKQKTKENKRMRASFDSMKELNDSMKKQLNELTEQNRKLECQSRKVQARLENLQRKYESFTTHRGQEVVFPKASKVERPATYRTAAGGASARGPELKLLPLLLDWLTDGPLAELRNEPTLSAPRPSLQERCAKVLPVLVDHLHRSVALDESLRFSLLRCIYCSLLCLERSAQLLLTSTLRRLGEEVSRGSADGRGPLFRSSCLHTRFLCSLIVLKTVSRVDLVAQAVDVLSRAVRSDEGRALFLEYRALPAVLALLRGGCPGLLAPCVDVLLQMSSESRVQAVFLDQCGCEDFFRCASLLLRSPRLEPALMENILVLLHKLSGLRKNRRLFEVSSLHLLLQELHRTTDRSHAFTCLNLSAILINISTHTHTAEKHTPDTHTHSRKTHS